MLVGVAMWACIEFKYALTAPDISEHNSGGHNINGAGDSQTAASRGLLSSGVEIIPGFTGGKCGSNFYYEATSRTSLSGKYRPGDTIQTKRDTWRAWTANYPDHEPYPDSCYTVDGVNICRGATAYAQWEANSGGLLYVIGSIYLFLGIAIICDGGFTDSLEMICSRYGLNLSPNVAGATFMAAGSSAPELATSFLGVFVAKSSVGLGTILGSAVFNILIIIGAVAILTGEPLKLDYRPVIRDNFFYAVSVILICIQLAVDDEANLVDTIVLLIWYGLYILFLAYNDYCMEKLGFTAPEDSDEKEDQVITETQTEVGVAAVVTLEPEEVVDKEDKAEAVAVGAAAQPVEVAVDVGGVEFTPEAEVKEDPVEEAVEEEVVEKDVDAVDIGDGISSEEVVEEKGSGNGAAAITLTVEEEPDEDGRDRANSRSALCGDEIEEGKEKEEEEKEEASCLDFWLAALSWPYEMIFKYTMPDCKMEFDDEVEEAWETEFEEATPERKKEMKKQMWDEVEECGPKWFWATFFISLFHITWLSYFMVEFMLKIGCLWSIPDVIMGLTFLAMGTSIPDALGSISVAKDGEGDMAVSNAVGSNVFDICIGLGLPWFIKLLMDAGKECNYIVIFNASKDVIPSIAILMGIIVILFTVFYVGNWTLYPQSGYALFAAYFLFIIYNFIMAAVDNDGDRCTLECCEN